jgi:hypothetical protein
VGLDRLSLGLVIALVLACAACGHGGRPKLLLHGEPAGEFRPVPGSVISIARALRGTTLGRRFDLCRPPAVAFDALVVERIGVVGESLTFADRRGRTLHSCDGGIDPAGERSPPWCGGSAGLLFDGRLLDPRLDILCRDSTGRPLAYAWVEPVAGAHWIAVDQGAYAEIYEVIAAMPVRIATARHIELARARATFDVTQYDVHGRALVKATVEASVAG